MTKHSLIFLIPALFISCSSIQMQNDSGAHEIKKVLEILSFEKMNECFPGEQSWPQAALLKKSIDIDFKHSNNCDFAGKFAASYLEKIPMIFTLKDFDEFTKATALVKLHISQHRNGVYYGFEVIEGSLIGPKKRVPFTAKYKVDTDPLTNEIKPGTEKGEIHLLEPGLKKKIKQTVPFTFD